MLNEKIKTLRKNRGFTQEELASRIHVTRQTISKWEKGYSVPDAQNLADMAEVLEVSVADLLDNQAITPQESDAVAEQLARINEQLVIRNRRSRRIWKTIGIVLLAIVLIIAVTAVLGKADLSGKHDSGNKEAGSTTWTCTLDGQTYEYEIAYNEEYQILSFDGDEYMADEFADYTDANDLSAAVKDYFESHGGTVEVTEQTNLQLQE